MSVQKNNMSRIGKKPVKIVEEVTVSVNDKTVTAVGTKGTLNMTFRPEVKVTISGNDVLVERTSETAKAKSVHGLTKTLIENMVMGVSKGWNKGLEIIGVGYKAALEGNLLVLNVGFSHQVKFPSPEGITFEVMENTKINRRFLGRLLY